VVGVNYEITVNAEMNEEELRAKLQILGELIIQDVKAKIRDFNLIETSDYLMGWTVEARGNRLVFDNTEEYALYLEYGTYAYYEQYQGTWPTPRHPKKKNISQEAAEDLPSGMQPFAPFRRTVQNQQKMTENIQKVFGDADVEVSI